jgi:hypothetical protein
MRHGWTKTGNEPVEVELFDTEALQISSPPP